MINNYDFRRAYPGPNGPHLNCLTRYTRTQKESDRIDPEKNFSIHPRNWFKKLMTKIMEESDAKS